MRAETIGKALNGRAVVGTWMARCPLKTQQASSSSGIERDGRPLGFCHLGCVRREVAGALEVPRCRDPLRNIGWVAA